MSEVLYTIDIGQIPKMGCCGEVDRMSSFGGQGRGGGGGRRRRKRVDPSLAALSGAGLGSAALQ